MSGYAFTPDGFTDLGGIPVVSSPVVPDGQWLLSTDPATGATVAMVGEYDAEASAVIAAELVACTLGQRVRPELQADAEAHRHWFHPGGYVRRRGLRPAR